MDGLLIKVSYVQHFKGEKNTVILIQSYLLENILIWANLEQIRIKYFYFHFGTINISTFKLKSI